ncbi:hypothetical protein Kisp01_67140 [Kineosporia sp. NBRC 101677]|uniref:hypothetical protein n=1 Tax=Kineosporia sp. NBRC 101677 TaxID=3032197 RepID=UPI0024A58284|nr:hypothetical protein [Kineosporia sp. NBRC 101677]GLY19700.1 hypothetical protein Kisp01_67140 [Kineosporia sp. NBRC 101677]
MNNDLSVGERLRVRGLILSFVAALAAALSLVATAEPSRALSPDKGVVNGSSTLSIGLIEVWPGQTSTYDFTIPPYSDSQSVEAPHRVQGVYIGPGYCAQRWTYPTRIATNSTLWKRAGADFPPGRYQLLGDFWVKIVAYRGTC